MTNTSSRRKTGGINGWLIIAIIIGVTVLGLVLIGHLNSPPEEAAAARKARISAEFDAKITSDKRFGPMFTRFKAAFPADYEALKSREIDAYISGAGSDQLSNISYNYMRRFSASHAGELAAAPAANLKAYREAQLTAITTLRAASEDLCADYANTGLRPGAKLDDASLTAVSQVGIVMLDGIIAGHDHPTPRGAMTNSDYNAMFRQMQREGLTPYQTNLLANPSELDAASSHDRCAIGVLVVRSVNDLPPVLADKATAEMIREAAKEAPAT